MVARNAEEVGAVSHLEVAIGCIVIADEAQAVGSDGHRGVLTDLVCAVEGGEGGGSAGPVRAMGHLEGAVGHVAVTDEA